MRNRCRLDSYGIHTLLPAIMWLVVCGNMTFAQASLDAQMNRAESALSRGDDEAAVATLEKLLADFSDEPAVMRLAGDVYLRTGDYKQAVEWFDKYIEQRPAALPYLWQRGIALYFAGDYQAGAKQFDVHRRVNPNDVENAAWHFLCVAKAQSFDRAKKMVLPAPGDPRVPMAQVLAMLRTGDTQSVRDSMQGLPEDTPPRQRAEFYGHFYLGLYADAQGKTAKALQQLEKSASEAPHHYMGDVARVYVQYLRRQVPPKRRDSAPDGAPANEPLR